jgi:hypothetical protein
MGVNASKIPGEPLIRYTNEVLLLRKSKEQENSNLRLAPEDEMLLEPTEKELLHKENVRQNQDRGPYLDPLKENRYLGIKRMRGLNLDRGQRIESLSDLQKIDLSPLEIDKNKIIDKREPATDLLRKPRGNENSNLDLLGPLKKDSEKILKDNESDMNEKKLPDGNLKEKDEGNTLGKPLLKSERDPALPGEKPRKKESVKKNPGKDQDSQRIPMTPLY